MHSIKNLQVNKKASHHKNKYKLVVGALAAVLIITGVSIGATSYKNTMEQNQISTIVEYYGQDSQENKILDYLAISDKLNSLNLDSYTIEESLFSKYNISNELKTPEELNQLIDNLKASNSFISSKDILKQSNNIELVLNLKKQEELVNHYIYTTGYSIANNNIATATKKYAAEVFGIEGYNNINFNYSFDKSSGEEVITINNFNKNQYNYDKKVSYSINGMFLTKEESKIKKGVNSMIDTNISSDKNLDDNNKYNKERNIHIKEALEQSALLEREVEDNYLYNGGLSSKMR